MDSIVANDYPKDLMEILVIDGMSTGNSRAVLAQYMEKYPFIQIVDNPGWSKPKTLNTCFKAVTGLLRMIFFNHSSSVEMVSV